MNIVLLSLVMMAASGTVDAVALQGRLEAAKAHYAAAAYEEALSELAGAQTGAPEQRAEIEQYRVLCLIALGRIPEAERAVALLVEASPRYMLSPEIASPRVLSLVSEMRRKEVPVAARRLLDAGRHAFERKELSRARESFSLLMDLLDDEAAAGLPGLDDLRAVAAGFLTLGEAMATPAAQPAPAAESAGAPPAESTPVQPAPVVPAVAIQQAVPTWLPPDAATASRTFRGAIRVRIGTDGLVKSATLEETSHPAYDQRLLKAAEKWVYEPATRDGVPVESEKVVVVHLSPGP